MSTIDANEPAPSAGQTLREVRRRQRRRLLLRVFLVVVLPTALVGAYLQGVATPQYQSVAVIAIDSPDASAVLHPIPGTNLPRDVKLAQEHVRSREMLTRLIERARFREHYQQAHLDWGSRLSADASFEETFEYYLEHVDADYDPQTSFLTLRVRAFSGEGAHRFASAILAATEEMIGAESARIRQWRISAAERDSESATARVAAVRREIYDLERRIRAASTAPAAAEGEPSADLSELEGELAQATVRRELALRTFQGALDSLETARSDATRQHRYVVRVSEPSRPDIATHPKVLRTMFTGFLASLMILVIGSLLLAAVREHAQF